MQKRMEYPAGSLFKTDFKKNHPCVCHRMTAMGQTHTWKQLPGPVPCALSVFLREASSLQCILSSFPAKGKLLERLCSREDFRLLVTILENSLYRKLYSKDSYKFIAY